MRVVECPWAAVLWWAQRLLIEEDSSLGKSASALAVPSHLVTIRLHVNDEGYYTTTMEWHKDFVCDSLG